MPSYVKGLKFNSLEKGLYLEQYKASVCVYVQYKASVCVYVCMCHFLIFKLKKFRVFNKD